MFFHFDRIVNWTGENYGDEHSWQFLSTRIDDEVGPMRMTKYSSSSHRLFITGNYPMYLGAEELAEARRVIIEVPWYGRGNLYFTFDAECFTEETREKMRVQCLTK